MPRTKGKASEKTQDTTVEALSLGFINAPTEHDSSPSPSGSSEENRKRVSSKKKQKKNKKVLLRESKHKTDDGKPYVRGHAAIKAYWQKLGSHLGADVNLEDLKKTVRNLRNIAIAQLKTTGSFRLYGICEMRIRNLKGRPSKKSRCFGADITMKERPPFKRVYARCVKELSDACVKEQNA